MFKTNRMEAAGVFCIAAVVALCSLPLTAAASTEVQKLEACKSGGRFGFSNAVKGDFIVVGAPGCCACVFERDGVNWVTRATLENPEPGGMYRLFGHAVAIDGDWIVVGAPYFDPVGGNPGFVSVFHREGDTWVETQRLVPSGWDITDGFGWSVAIEGDVIVVGSPGENSALGVTYVYRLVGAEWVEEQALIPAVQGKIFDNFGHSVSISGDVIVATSPGDASACPPDADEFCYSGAGFVFNWNGTTWVEGQKLTASDAEPYEAFSPVSISGDTIVIGNSVDADQGTDSGAVYVFRNQGGQWVEDAKLIPADAVPDDYFGWSLSVDGNVFVAAGAAGVDRGGSGYLFWRSGTGWHEFDKLVASDGASIGRAVSIDAEVAVVGPGYVFSVTRDIPAVSSWGLFIFALVVATAGSLVLRGRLPLPRQPTLSGRYTRAVGMGITALLMSNQVSAQMTHVSFDARLGKGIREWTRGLSRPNAGRPGAPVSGSGFLPLR